MYKNYTKTTRCCKLHVYFTNVSRSIILHWSFRSIGRDEFDLQTRWKKTYTCIYTYAKSSQTTNQFAFRKQHLFRRDLFANLCIRSRQAKRSVWLKAMIVGGLCVSDQCSKRPDTGKIFCAIAMWEDAMRLRLNTSNDVPRIFPLHSSLTPKCIVQKFQRKPTTFLENLWKRQAKLLKCWPQQQWWLPSNMLFLCITFTI